MTDDDEFDPDDPEATVARLGNLARLVGATLRDTATVTMLSAWRASKSDVVARRERLRMATRAVCRRRAGSAWAGRPLYTSAAMSLAKWSTIPPPPPR